MDIEETISKYSGTLQATYRLFATRVQDLLTSLLKAKGVVPHSITSREKSPVSLREKMQREGKSYTNPLEDITDLAGVRVITYFPTDVDRVLPMIEKEFIVDDQNSIDKRKTSDPSVFGYASVHLVIGLSQERLRLAEYAVFEGLKCEIQVRTILQHAWAEIEHDIVYKSSQDIPFELRRKFASLAGLLEVADREFEVLRQDEMRIRDEIQSTIKSKNIHIPVDMESVRFYLQNYRQEKEFRPEAVSQLVRLLSKCHVETIDEFHRMLSKEALVAADHTLSQVEFRCESPERCLLRYVIVLGKQCGIVGEELAREMHCSALKHASRGVSEERRGSRKVGNSRGQSHIAFKNIPRGHKPTDTTGDASPMR